MVVWPECKSAVTYIFKPNASLPQVVQDLKALADNLSKQDTVIVITGSNHDIV